METDTRQVAELVQLLRDRADDIDPAWSSFGVLYTEPQPDVIRSVQSLNVGVESRSAWVDPARNSSASRMLRAWLGELRHSGTPWSAFFVAAERASGKVETFVVHPDDADADLWAVDPANADEIMDAAWSRVAIDQIG